MKIQILKLQTICYVCGKIIKGKEICIGNNMYRHQRCRPGTYRWLHSHAGKKSIFRKLFLHQDE